MDRVDGNAHVERLKVDQYGHVSNWPAKFFGDAIGEIERQADKRFAREFGGTHG